jgi:hypothetical protein
MKQAAEPEDMTMNEIGRRGGRFDPSSLPEFRPDPALWARIVACQQQRVARRRWQVAGVLGGAVAATFAVVLLAPGLRHATPDDGGHDTAQEQSRALEREWAGLAVDHAAKAGGAHLRAIDAQLQSAYDRGAGVEELSPLWQQRNRALRGLIDGLRSGAADRGDSITQI